MGGVQQAGRHDHLGGVSANLATRRITSVKFDDELRHRLLHPFAERRRVVVRRVPLSITLGGATAKRICSDGLKATALCLICTRSTRTATCPPKAPRC
jgi:hypothetical protein